MSKQYFKMPLKWNTITTYFSSNHLAIDLGWNSKQGGKNVPIYAIADGEVISNTSNNATGYMVWIQTDDGNNRWLHRYIHMQKKSSLKVGAKVKQGDLVGYMGNTGDSNGEHLHLDLWKCPAGYKYNWNDRKKYSVNPTDYCYLFDDQTTGESNKGIIRLLGTFKKVARDTSKNQIEVIGSKLRIRKGAGTNQTVLGYVDYGIYDFIETKTSNNYTWYNLGFGWIAGTKEDTKIYLKQEHLPDNGKVIEELEKQIEELTNQLDEQKRIIEQQKEQLEELVKEKEKTSDLRFFIAITDDYHIVLRKGQKIYYQE